MVEYRLVNDNGLVALKEAAVKFPSQFLDASPDTLWKTMEEVVHTDDLWGPVLDIRSGLSLMNGVTEGGPGTDAAFVPLVRQALGHLPPSEGLNDYRWATINCFVVPQYVSARWPAGNLVNDKKRLSEFVNRHWLKGHLTDARQDNAIARLWWLGELSERAARHSDRYGTDDILNAMANNVNLYHQLLYRRNIVSRAKLVAAIYEVFLDDNDYLGATRYASELLSALNYRAADISLDFMELSELREVVEEAKPPKER